MMLATNTFYPVSDYLPRRPSPLSPRSANAGSKIFPTCSMSQLSDLKRSGSAFKRPYKANLLVCGSDKIKEKRREQFLRKVERSRDDKTWETRGDQIMRMDYKARHKRWEAEQAQIASHIVDDMDDDEYDLPSSSSQQDSYALSQPSQMIVSSSQKDDDEVEAVLQQEDEELKALIELMEEEEQQASNSPSHFGSDDDDYDSLFMHVITEEVGEQPQDRQDKQKHTDDAMDTSNG